MRIVDDWGVLFEMTEQKFKSYLSAGARGLEPDPEKYGRRIGKIAFSTVDMAPREYAYALQELKLEKRTPS